MRQYITHHDRHIIYRQTKSGNQAGRLRTQGKHGAPIEIEPQHRLKIYLLVNMNRAQSKQLWESELLKEDKDLMRELLGNLHSVASVSVAPKTLCDPAPQHCPAQRYRIAGRSYIESSLLACPGLKMDLLP